MSLFYLFTRFQFNWSEVEFSFFSTYSMAIHLIGKYSFPFILTALLTSMFPTLHRYDILGEHILQFAES